jgi:hypothetical protein
MKTIGSNYFVKYSSNQFLRMYKKAIELAREQIFKLVRSHQHVKFFNQSYLSYILNYGY